MSITISADGAWGRLEVCSVSWTNALRVSSAPLFQVGVVHVLPARNRRGWPCHGSLDSADARGGSGALDKCSRVHSALPHEVFMYSLPESEVGGSAAGLDGADALGGSDALDKCSSEVRFAVAHEIYLLFLSLWLREYIL